MLNLQICTDDPSSPTTTSSDSCPFNSLHLDVKWNILKYLEFSHYRNLAFTCRLWYQTAINAPDHVKPTVVARELYYIYGLLSNHTCFTATNAKLLLFKKWKCERLSINSSTNPRLLRFISENRSLFDIKTISINLPMCAEQVHMALASIMSFSSELSINRYSYYYGSLRKSCRLGELKLFEEYLDHTIIRNVDCPSLDGSRLVLEQWVKGQRPNLIRYTATLKSSRPTTAKTFRNMARNIQEFVRIFQHPYHDERLVHYCLQVNVPDMPTVTVHLIGQELTICPDHRRFQYYRSLHRSSQQSIR